MGRICSTAGEVIVNKWIAGAAVAAALTLASPASATVVYDFSGYWEGYGAVSVFITASDFITLPGVSATLDTCSVALGPCFNVWLELDGAPPMDVFWVATGTAPNINDVDIGWQFDPGSFASLGTFYSTVNAPGEYGTLVVSELNPAVPEPATWVMMLLGFGAAGFAFRRRRPAELMFRQAA
jgi:hypothetical protein